MAARKKSVISLISYDANLLVDSIASYYRYVDEIVLGVDQDRISWSGNRFYFDEDKLWKALKNIDVDNKIVIIEDNFHRSKVPIENDTNERNFLKNNCSHDWVFSFDADEILVNAKEFFIDFCPIVQDYEDIELMFTWFLMYKKVENGYLVISDETGNHIFNKDIQGFTAHRDLNTFTYCRWTNAEKKILSPLAIKHFSFCRDDAELNKKINNFGHSIESKKDPFYETRKLVNSQNYTQLKNFKTSGMGAQWPSLQLIPFEQVDTFMRQEAKRLYV
jgi:hypothetical protein